MATSAPAGPVTAAAEGSQGRGTAAPGRPPSRSLQIALVLGAFIGMADATIVAVALEPLGRHFGVALGSAQTVLSLYLITITATVPTLGRLGDRWGRRTVYLGGFAVFAVGSLLAALAPSFAVLLLGRVIQAVGGGLLTAGSLALIVEHSGRRSAGRSVALLVVAQAVAGLLGPPVGGLLVALGGWQAVFWAGLPLAAAGCVLGVLAIPRGHVRSAATGIDPLGALGLAILLLGIGAGVGGLGNPGLGGLPAAGWFGIAAVGALLLAVVEPRVRMPLLDRRLLHGRFGLAAIATLMSTGSLMSCFALLPFWLEGAHGASAAVAGAAFVPIAVGIGATSRRAGQLGDLGRTRSVTSMGMILAAAGLCLVAAAALTRLWPLLGIGLLVLGCGNGLFSAPNTAAAMTVAPRSALGSASAFLSTARNTGVILGLGMTGAIYGAAVGPAGSGPRADSTAAALFAAAAAICLAVAALSSRVYRSGGDERGD